MSKAVSEQNLVLLLKDMAPFLNEGDYVFCAIDDLQSVNPKELLFTFREKEAITIITRKEMADNNNLTYFSVMAWITLTVHSSLEAVGLTAAFSAALANEAISCNVVAGFYHDHIFVAKKDAERAMAVLAQLAGS